MAELTPLEKLDAAIARTQAQAIKNWLTGKDTQ